MRKSKYLPLFLIEGYLIATIFLFIFGPLHFEVHNKILFWSLLIMYHLAFITGYMIRSRVKIKSRKCEGHSIRYIRSRYNICLVVSFLVWIVFTRSNTKSTSILPIGLLKNAIAGLINPSLRYYWKVSEAANTQFRSSAVVTATVILFYFAYYCLPALLIIYWNKITYIQKILSGILILLSILVGLSVGTNSMIFHEVFALIGGFIIRRYATGQKFSKMNQKKIKLVLGLLMVAAIVYFSHNIHSRLGGQEVAYYKSKSVDITVSDLYNVSSTSSFSQLVFGPLASIEYYICQGYYGMSLALDQEFTTTFGLGHSFYMIKKFDKMFSTDMFARTYQAKIDDIWSSTVNWHSFYSQMANDVGFIGVIFIMLLLGILVSTAWMDIMYSNNFFAKCLCVLLVALFIFMPANNQLGNMTGTLFAFWEVFFLWMVSRKTRVRLGSYRI